MSEYWELKEKGLVKVLTLNIIKCLECNTVLESKHQHHFVTCGCKNQTFNDGGNVYQRYMGKDLDKVENLSKYIIMTEQEYEGMLEKKRIKDEEILQKKIESGEMIQFGGNYIHKSTWKLIMDNCLKLGDK